MEQPATSNTEPCGTYLVEKKLEVTLDQVILSLK